MPHDPEELATSIASEISDHIVLHGKANLQRGWEAVGGVLCVTREQIMFEAHRANLQKEPLRIPLREVEGVQKCWTKLLGLVPMVPNSISVTTSAGDEHRFVVMGRDRWIDAILGAREALQGD